MLSIPYELLGNKVAASVELRVRLQKYEVPILGVKTQCDSTMGEQE